MSLVSEKAAEARSSLGQDVGGGGGGGGAEPRQCSGLACCQLLLA